MKQQKISLSFSNYSDANFATRARFILDSMNGNPAYPTPVPALGDVEDSYTDYNNARMEAEGLGRLKVAEKNKNRLVLQQLLIELGRYVMFTANGDAATLTSSGYSLTKIPEPQHMGPVGNVTLSNGITSGQLLASIKRPKGANNFLHEIADELPTDNTVWISSSSSRSRYTFSNLQPGKQYWVRVAAVATNRQIAYSPVVTVYVQ